MSSTDFNLTTELIGSNSPPCNFNLTGDTTEINAPPFEVALELEVGEIGVFVEIDAEPFEIESNITVGSIKVYISSVLQDIYALPIINKEFHAEYSLRLITNDDKEVSYDLSSLASKEIEATSILQVGNEFEANYELSYPVKREIEVEYTLNISVNTEIEHENIIADTVTMVTMAEYDLNILSPVNTEMKGIYTLFKDSYDFNSVSLTAEI